MTAGQMLENYSTAASRKRHLGGTAFLRLMQYRENHRPSRSSNRIGRPICSQDTLQHLARQICRTCCSVFRAFPDCRWSKCGHTIDAIPIRFIRAGEKPQEQ